MTRGCGLRETSRVDYTERRKTEREREKRKMFYITGPPQREEKFCVRKKN